MHDMIHERIDNPHIHLKTEKQKNERKFFNKIADGILPVVAEKLRGHVDEMKNNNNRLKKELANTIRTFNHLVHQNNFDKERYMAQLKQVQLNLLRSRDNYGLKVAELTRALQRTKHGNRAEYDEFYRFEDREDDRAIGKAYGIRTEELPDKDLFDNIYKRNLFKERNLSRDSYAQERGSDSLDRLGAYYHGYCVKNNAFDNYINSKYI